MLQEESPDGSSSKSYTETVMGNEYAQTLRPPNTLEDQTQITAQANEDKRREALNKREEGTKISAIRAGLGLPDSLKKTVPQPGESSGKLPLVDGVDSKLMRSETLTLEEILASSEIVQDSIPYYKDVYQDVLKGDLDWIVTRKVKEYADFLEKNPETLAILPPVQFLNNKLHDGAHRLSAIYLLSKLHPNSNWPRVKLKVDFYEGKIGK